MLNKVQLIGHVGQDPEVRETPQGTKVADLRLATTRYWRDGEGNRQEETEWHRVVFWGKTAENVASRRSRVVGNRPGFGGGTMFNSPCQSSASCQTDRCRAACATGNRRNRDKTRAAECY